MSVIYVLIPIAILLVCIAIAVFFWAVKSNQFDDLERHGHSILFDDDIKQHKPSAPDLPKVNQDVSNTSSPPDDRS